MRSVNSKREALTKLNERDINILLEHEAVLNSFVSSYYYTNLIYERILKNVKFFEEDKEIINDLMIEAHQGFDLCKSSLKTISNIRNHYVILLSNKLNNIITLLTVLTVFISVPAAVSGIYGMNVALPFESNPLIFYYIILFIWAVWMGFFLFFKRKRII